MDRAGGAAAVHGPIREPRAHPLFRHAALGRYVRTVRRLRSPEWRDAARQPPAQRATGAVGGSLTYPTRVSTLITGVGYVTRNAGHGGGGRAARRGGADGGSCGDGD